jgi:hypothetical protein
MPKASLDDVWIYIYENGDVRTRDLEAQFVKTKQIARGTMYKYKRQLELEGKIQAKPVQSRPPYNLYFVPKRFHKRVEALKQYKSLPLTYDVSNAGALEWTDAPKGMYLTAVKEKILWHDEKTGAIMTLNKFPPGLYASPRIRPKANAWFYTISGEAELPDGRKGSNKGFYGFLPKGVTEIGVKLTKETLVFTFYDGPRDIIEVQPLEIAVAEFMLNF